MDLINVGVLYISEDAQHKRRMAEGEIAARGYVPKFFQNVPAPAKPDYRNESNEDYERRRRFESLISQTKYEADKENGYFDSNHYDAYKNTDNSGD